MPAPVLKVIPWFLVFSGIPVPCAAADAAPIPATVSAAADPAQPVAAPVRIPHAAEFTRAERISRAARALPRGPVVAFPVPGMPEPFDLPRRWPADPATRAYRAADNPDAFVRQLPADETLDGYLAKRRELKPDQWQTLVNWCLDQHLPACAEYELRCKLATYKHFYDPGYKAVKDQWLKLAADHRAGYIFPLPVEGEWFVVPDTSGHHRLKAGAAFAFDLTILKNGRMHQGDGRQLTDYYAWRQPILAQADAVVLQADDHFPDLSIDRGATLAEFDQANYVILDFGGGLRALYGHLRQGSLTVKVGDSVKAGQKLAEVGNSGASGAPHLHFTLLDAGHLSLRGRFQYERLAGNTWVAFDGDDLKEGAQVRNLETAFAAPAPVAATAETAVAPAAPAASAAAESVPRPVSTSR